MAFARAHRGGARFLSARYGGPPPRRGIAAGKSVLPALAVLARRQPGASLQTRRFRHGGARKTVAAVRRRAAHRWRSGASAGESGTRDRRPRMASAARTRREGVRARAVAVF